MIIWEYQDVDGNHGALSDDLVLGVRIADDPEQGNAVSIDEYSANKLIEALWEYTAAATQRALRADELAAAAQHLRAAGIHDASTNDVIDAAIFIAGRRS